MAKDSGPDGVPPVEIWWPHLTIGARHTLLDAPQAPLDSRVRAEIERITRTPVAPGAQLSSKDLSFLKTQQEPVD